jgi:hypothetical protein
LVKTTPAGDQETVYDLAIRLYKDARGISDILLMNPSLDLDAATYFGQLITYDDAVIYKKEVLIVTAPEPARPSWIVRQGQSIYDLALQVYGDVSSLGKILAQFENLNDPTTGELVSTEYTDNFLANTLFSREIVATSQDFDTENGGIGFMIIESTFIVG